MVAQGGHCHLGLRGQAAGFLLPVQGTPQAGFWDQALQHTATT